VPFIRSHVCWCGHVADHDVHPIRASGRRRRDVFSVRIYVRSATFFCARTTVRRPASHRCSRSCARRANRAARSLRTQPFSQSSSEKPRLLLEPALPGSRAPRLWVGYRFSTSLFGQLSDGTLCALASPGTSHLNTARPNSSYSPSLPRRFPPRFRSVSQLAVRDVRERQACANCPPAGLRRPERSVMFEKHQIFSTRSLLSRTTSGFWMAFPNREPGSRPPRNRFANAPAVWGAESLASMTPPSPPT